MHSLNERANPPSLNYSEEKKKKLLQEKHADLEKLTKHSCMLHKGKNEYVNTEGFS